MTISDRAIFFLTLLAISMIIENSAFSQEVSPVPVAQCCGLNLRFEIQRYPRYPRHSVSDHPRLIVLASQARELKLPALDEGGYRLIFEPIALISGRQYRLAVDMQSREKVGLLAEVFAGRRKVASTYKGITGQTKGILQFTASKDPVTRDGKAIHVLKLWVSGKADVVIKHIALTKEDGSDLDGGARALLLPDSALGVYDTGQGGEMQLLPAPGQTAINYTIEQILPKKLVLKMSSLPEYGVGPVQHISLATEHDGYFRIGVHLKSNDGQTIQVSRYYVVIDPIHRPPQERRFYGMCTEEEGLTDFVPAAVTADEIYHLLERMGVGSVRMFNPAMPNELSMDGIHYDFHVLDTAISTAHHYGMEILLELGSNNLSRLPSWLLTGSPDDQTIDLRRGMRFFHQKQAFKDNGYDRTPYFDLKKYRTYLKRLFDHIGGLVRNFEIWNEPGHKFLAKDFIRISRITREVQKKYAPESRLVGFSSTAYPGFGNGKNMDVMPGFLKDMLRLGGGGLVDVISYHSRHAFNFLGRKDQTDPRTDYAARIMKLLKSNGYADLPVWDTERGVPWSSLEVRMDKFGPDRGPLAWLKPFNLMEPAIQIPIIFSQALSQQVQRVYWFNLLPGTENITRKHVRESIFDIGLSPTAVIFQYASWSLNHTQ